MGGGGARSIKAEGQWEPFLNSHNNTNKRARDKHILALGENDCLTNVVNVVGKMKGKRWFQSSCLKDYRYSQQFSCEDVCLSKHWMKEGKYLIMERRWRHEGTGVSYLFNSFFLNECFIYIISILPLSTPTPPVYSHSLWKHDLFFFLIFFTLFILCFFYIMHLDLTYAFLPLQPPQLK